MLFGDRPEDFSAADPEICSLELFRRPIPPKSSAVPPLGPHFYQHTLLTAQLNELDLLSSPRSVHGAMRLAICSIVDGSTTASARYWDFDYLQRGVRL